ncbi:KdsC family phosphatase [Nitrincola tapanii]|uniref:3-deoxy-D-manno-octulosonate 8-phosphate phosphatase KdsC n=1 Tax=Nitrincola tapanii TaxID=1708751 RepID=A0A5A9VZY2_9GAMM|nr:HAD hydrolase family protein [Nitrincola tapanii]KAA0874060.1 HAD family hydrolase [Nitrincola tapanii]
MSQPLSNALIERLQPVKLVVFDVDGVLTNGQLLFLPDGQEIKTFNTLDGLGIKLLHQAGLKTAIITGRSSSQVTMRAKALGITYLLQGREDKLDALTEIWKESGESARTTAYIGDDLPDLSAITTVAFGASVPNGHPLVCAEADWCTRRSGGEGAAREFCETILSAQGKLQSLLEAFR